MVKNHSLERLPWHYVTALWGVEKIKELYTPEIESRINTEESRIRSYTMYDLKKFHPIQRNDLIRLGKDGDGGYVVSKEQIQKTETLLSFGINDDWSFEIEFDKEKHIKILAFDYSVSWKGVIDNIRDGIGHIVGGLLILRRSWIVNAYKHMKYLVQNYRNIEKYFSPKHDRFFYPKYLNNYNDRKNITINNIFDNLIDAEKLSIFIKMDIEGAEYKSLMNLAPYFDKINGMVIEFHYLEKQNDLNDFKSITESLLKYFEVIHIHGNTYGGAILNTLLPTTPEITFINKNLLSGKIIKSTMKYPVNGLDIPYEEEETLDFILPYNYTDDIDKIVLPYKRYK